MKKLNNKGSTIITGIIIVMILLIITGTTLGIAYNYQKRAINEHARKQAYLNGISVVDAIAEKIHDGNDDFIPTNGNISFSYDQENPDKNIKMPDDIGEVSAEILYEEKNNNVNKDVILIQVKSTYYYQTEEVQLTLQKYNGEWYKKAYTKIGETFSDEES